MTPQETLDAAAEVRNAIAEAHGDHLFIRQHDAIVSDYHHAIQQNRVRRAELLLDFLRRWTIEKKHYLPQPQCG